MVMAAPESRLSSSAFGPQITSYFLYFAAPVPLRGPEKAAGPRHWSHNPTSQQLVSQTNLDYLFALKLFIVLA